MFWCIQFDPHLGRATSKIKSYSLLHTNTGSNLTKLSCLSLPLKQLLSLLCQLVQLVVNVTNEIMID